MNAKTAGDDSSEDRRAAAIEGEYDIARESALRDVGTEAMEESQRQMSQIDNRRNAQMRGKKADGAMFRRITRRAGDRDVG